MGTDNHHLFTDGDHDVLRCSIWYIHDMENFEVCIPGYQTKFAILNICLL